MAERLDIHPDEKAHERANEKANGEANGKPNSKAYNLAPSATPCAVYGLLSIVLCWVPLVGLLFASLGWIRGRHCGVELASDTRLQGQRLVSLGLWLCCTGVALGLAAIVWWGLAIWNTTGPGRMPGGVTPGG